MFDPVCPRLALQLAPPFISWPSFSRVIPWHQLDYPGMKHDETRNLNHIITHCPYHIPFLIIRSLFVAYCAAQDVSVPGLVQWFCGGMESALPLICQIGAVGIPCRFPGWDIRKKAHGLFRSMIDQKSWFSHFFKYKLEGISYPMIFL